MTLRVETKTQHCVVLHLQRNNNDHDCCTQHCPTHTHTTHRSAYKTKINNGRANLNQQLVGAVYGDAALKRVVNRVFAHVRQRLIAGDVKVNRIARQLARLSHIVELRVFYTLRIDMNSQQQQQQQQQSLLQQQ
jgi:hypothetical protein